VPSSTTTINPEAPASSPSAPATNANANNNDDNDDNHNNLFGLYLRTNANAPQLTSLV